MIATVIPIFNSKIFYIVKIKIVIYNQTLFAIRMLIKICNYFSSMEYKSNGSNILV